MVNDSIKQVQSQLRGGRICFLLSVFCSVSCCRHANSLAVAAGRRGDWMQGRGEESCAKEGEKLQNSRCVSNGPSSAARRASTSTLITSIPSFPSKPGIVHTSTDGIAEPQQYWLIPLRASKLSVGNKADCPHQRRHRQNSTDTNRVLSPQTLSSSRPQPFAFRDPVRRPGLPLSCSAVSCF
ncbi:hypothetical protein V8C26DRAFT_389429 [Trichoderma gracile]